MVQVIHEEGAEEYWQKPLREAILNIGNSWAGSIIRRQNSAASYAKNAADRAHEAYIAQIGINSREKIAGATLAATKERNETLNKQYAETSRLAQDRENRESDQWAYQKTNDLNDINATGASQVILSSMNDLMVDEHGFIVTNKLSKDELAKQNAIMAKSPAVAKAYQPAVQDYFKRQKIITGRLRMLQILQGTKGNENAISRILNEPDQKIDILQLRGAKGSEQDARLQALGAQIRDDDTWTRILASYKIDKVTADSLKSHEYKDLIRHSIVLGDNELDTGIHAFERGDQNQIARTEGYHSSKETMTKLFPADHKDTTALLGAVKNMGEGFVGIGQNTAEYVGGAVIDFMQEHAVYFTNPAKVGAAIRRRMIQVATAGPDGATEEYEETIEFGPNKGKKVMRPADKNLRDPLNVAIHELMFDAGDPSDKRKMAKDIMLKFLEGEGWHKGKNAQIRSSVTKRPEDRRAIADLFEGGGASNIADSTTTETIDPSGEGGPEPSDSFTFPGDGTANAATNNAGPPDILKDNLVDYSAKAGLKGGYLMDILKAPKGKEKMFGIADGKVEGGSVNLLGISTGALNHIMFSDRTDTPETKFWTDKRRNMRASYNPKSIDYNKETGKAIKPNPLDPFYPDFKASVKAYETSQHLEELYDTNQKIAEEQLLKPGFYEHLFSQTGPKAWLPATIEMSKDLRFDWSYLKTKFATARPGGEVAAEKMWDTIFKGMGIGKDEIDDGSYFGPGNRIRRLAESMRQRILAAQGQ